MNQGQEREPESGTSVSHDIHLYSDMHSNWASLRVRFPCCLARPVQSQSPLHTHLPSKLAHASAVAVN